MGELESAISRAREALASSKHKEALNILKPYKKSLKNVNSSNVPLHQIYADIYLENGQLEKAYPLLVHACELDPRGEIGGSEKFFILGQVAGGSDGIQMFMQGIESISSQAGDSLQQEQADKIVSGLLSMIEIWMTDLCMEANAESQCEELIAKAMEVSENQSPEAWSVLGSIRISQQRFLEAIEAFSQSWKYFQVKKEAIEEAAKNVASASLHSEFVELLQPLLNLSKMCIEMGLYDISLEIIGAVKDIDEDNLEGYYLEGFTHYLVCKLNLFKLANPNINLSAENVYEFNQHFQELPLDQGNPIIQEDLHEARCALTLAEKLAENNDPDDEFVQEIVGGTRALLQELGGPVDMVQLMKYKKGEEDEDEDEEFEVEDEEFES
ncbi:LAFE_0H07602g1_1 [Lachancea fermentati]|uniref:LAFE_0H07602g1_1 n=1 Tax=Lachancea fermentati TaxID=4955 RepID=A0A1G4MKB0_LACFM|nr:LAFE_0H07602g1_1 [Lachancea fermentati]